MRTTQAPEAVLDDLFPPHPLARRAELLGRMAARRDAHVAAGNVDSAEFWDSYVKELGGE